MCLLTPPPAQMGEGKGRGLGPRVNNSTFKHPSAVVNRNLFASSIMFVVCIS
jgi:hypothetical protein